MCSFKGYRAWILHQGVVTSIQGMFLTCLSRLLLSFRSDHQTSIFWFTISFAVYFTVSWNKLYFNLAQGKKWFLEVSCNHRQLSSPTCVITCNNPLYPSISMHFLLTVFYRFPMVLTRRILFTITSSFGNHFLYSHELNIWFSRNNVRRN